MVNLPLSNVPIVDYGPAEAEMARYREAGTRRALALGNRGPIRFDESGNLDPATGDQVAELLFEMNRTRGTTLVVVTHSRRMAEQLGRVLVLTGGRLAEGDGGSAVV